MAIHYESSFGESYSLRILSSKLEEIKTIKTMFGELDRIPNHDGYFELINTINNEPKKQFIVQIKHVNGKSTQSTWSYDFPTEFLHYVKKKVTENPAIVFIVDIKSRSIYWKYLSDDFLMNLNFENKKKVRLHFDKNEYLDDIQMFTAKLLEITTNRNRLFIYKSAKEIEEIQSAIEWLNDSLNSIPMIKKALYPNLWRFGLATSKSSISMESVNSNIENHFFMKNESAQSFSIYPQIKGKPDTGIRDFDKVEQPSFVTFDLTSLTTPLIYVKNCFEKMLENYFDYFPLDFSNVEEDIISEVLFCFLDKYAKANKKYSKFGLNATYSLNEVAIETVKGYFTHTMIYTQSLFVEHKTNIDRTIYSMILNHLGPMHSDHADILSFVSTLPNNSFIQYEKIDYQYNQQILTLISSDYLAFYYALLEAEKRGMIFATRVWPSKEEMLIDSQINGDLVLSLLPRFVEKTGEIYNKYFTKQFTDYNLMLCKKIEVNFGKEIPGNFWKHKYVAYWYDNDKLSIRYNNKISIDYKKNLELKDTIKGSMIGWGIDDYLLTGLPMYLGLKSFIYQGFCHKFDVKCKGILLNNYRSHLFD